MPAYTLHITTLFSKIRQVFIQSSDHGMTLGEVLKKRNIISEEQLRTALRVQQDKPARFGKGRYLGRIMVELGYTSEEDLVRALNDHYHLSIESLSDDIQDLIRRKRSSLIERLSKPRIPIWLQLSLLTTFTVVLTIFILNFVILSRQKEQLYRQTEKTGIVSLNYVTENAAVPLLEDDTVQLNSLIRSVTAVKGLLYGMIIDQDGVIKAHSDPSLIEKPFDHSHPPEKVTRKGGLILSSYTFPDGKNVLNLAKPVMFQEKRLGEVHVGVSVDFIEGLIQKDRSSLISIAALCVLLGVLTAVLLGFRFSKPISGLVSATREIAKGNYDFKVNLMRNDELGNLAQSFNEMSQELWEKSLVQKSFGKYVGPEVLEMIVENPQDNWLKGHRSGATILFADVRGFTSFSDHKEPEEVVEALNEYFEIATRTIFEHGGYIDKFMGDAVLGVFGVPIYRKQHVERAVRAAVDLQIALKTACDSGNKLLDSIGISIDSGVVVSGNIGSQVKMEYTVIGDSVNTAVRINSLAGPGEIIITKNVYLHLSHLVEVEPLPPQIIRGLDEPVEAFEVLRIKEPHNDRSQE